jgi:hypothetical protein
MKIPSRLSLICILILAGLLLVIPVSAETNATIDLNKPSLTVSVSPSAPNVGDTVVISGVAKGGNLTPGVVMWIFAGNYVNITNVPVNASGFYMRSVNTADLPPAYYYIFVQHPGSDSKFNINVKGFSGEVVNTNTGAVIFNFTGTGSVNDNAAAIALSNAFNTLGVDDIFSKTGVQLHPAGIVANASQTQVIKPETTASVTVRPTNPVTTTTAGTPVIPVATKAPLSIFSSVVGIGLVIIGMGLYRRN